MVIYSRKSLHFGNLIAVILDFIDIYPTSPSCLTSVRANLGLWNSNSDMNALT